MQRTAKRTVVHVMQALRLAKAYWRLTRRSPDPYQPYRWLERVYMSPLKIPRAMLGLLVPAALTDEAEIYIRQTLLNSIRIQVSQALIMEADRPGQARSYIMPGCWRDRLASQGIHVASWRSRMAWLWHLVASWRGAVATLRALNRQSRHGWEASDRPYTVFLGAPSMHVGASPHAAGYGYFDWLKRNPDIFAAGDEWRVVVPAGIDPGYRDVQRHAVHEPLPRLSSAGRRRFRIDAALLFGKAGLLMAAGGWWAGFLLAGALELAYCRQMDRLASQYVFTIASGVLRRPLWSYWAERCGATSTMIYYATNIDPLPGAWPFQSFPGMELQSWPRYVVFSDEQALRVRHAAVGQPEILVRGPIDYSDAPDLEIDLPAKTILVLDTPVRKLLWNPANGFIDHYYTPEFAEAFFRDIADIAARLGATVAWKAKRVQIGNHGPLSVKYVKAIEAACGSTPMIYLDPSIAPRRLARHAAVCVSAPFTSAAIAFHHGGGAAVYYDALARIPADSRRNDIVPLVNSKVDLENWLARQLSPESFSNGIRSA